MSMLAIRIPAELKKEMTRVHINWSEYLRRSITEALESEQKRELFRKIHSLAGNRTKTPKGTAAAIIRHMRDHA